MSDLVNEVTQMALQLDKYHSKLQEDTVTKDQETEAVENIGKILDKLYQIQITELLLERSKVAFSLKKIKKFSNPKNVGSVGGVMKRCGDLMKKWKNEYTDSKKVSETTTSLNKKRELPSNEVDKDKIEDGTTDLEPVTKKVKLELNGDVSSSSNSDTKYKSREVDRYKGLSNPWLVVDDREYEDLSASSKGVPIKIREKFYNLFLEGKDDHYPNVDNNDIARFICQFERALSNKYKGDEYKKKFRSFSLSLKNNPDLRRTFFVGNEEDRIKPDELVNFSAEQLQTKERQEAQAKIRQEELDKRDSSFQEKLALKNLKDSGIECRKCKGRKIYTYQVQMRSGDEPPTTFYQCLECKNEWRSGG